MLQTTRVILNQKHKPIPKHDWQPIPILMQGLYTCLQIKIKDQNVKIRAYNLNKLMN